MPGTVVVAQSGGPTPVINNSLRGVIEACRDCPSDFGRVYAAWHGIEGVLKEELLDIAAQPEEEIRLLATTPAAGSIGSCRYKLKAEGTADFARVLEVFRAHDVGHFFYIGGNDSMDTAHKIGAAAREAGMDLVVTGVPKTIDNDVGDQEFKLIDHTPGYGSTARFWACNIQNANEENMGSCPAEPVLVLQVMGRATGFIPAAARLGDPGREMPLQIYMPESGLTLEALADNVNDELRRSGRCIVVLSEGFDVGGLGERYDAFGHIDFEASDRTAQQVAVSYLNARGLAARGNARGQVAGTDQRATMIYASNVDLAEAYAVGRHAVEVARRHGNGWMATLLRAPGPAYRARYDKAPLERVANSERVFPSAWLAPNRIDVTDEYVAYARPLIGEDWVPVPVENGLQRFARFRKVFAERRCPAYVPRGYR
ncbi:MAG: diphosphate--fructose-6-phosphate 1-phosphotransferase [Lentisphaerae bacterium]|nr:diphosphate--fructose-6-phosphate 1-phosphotransferase [Lentisphaerota bacterium]